LRFGTAFDRGFTRITQVWRQERKQMGTTVVKARPDIFQQLQRPAAPIVDRMLGLTNADVADIAEYC